MKTEITLKALKRMWYVVTLLSLLPGLCLAQTYVPNGQALNQPNTVGQYYNNSQITLGPGFSANSANGVLPNAGARLWRVPTVSLRQGMCVQRPKRASKLFYKFDVDQTSIRIFDMQYVFDMEYARQRNMSTEHATRVHQHFRNTRASIGSL